MSAIGSASGRTATVQADVWMRPCASVCGHALHAMPARLELELRVRAVADDARDHLLVAAELGRRLGHDLDLPSIALRIARRTCGTGRRRTAPTRRRRCPARISRNTLRSSFASFGSSAACSSPSSAAHPREPRPRASPRANCGELGIGAIAVGGVAIRFRLDVAREHRRDGADLRVLLRQRAEAIACRAPSPARRAGARARRAAPSVARA